MYFLGVDFYGIIYTHPLFQCFDEIIRRCRVIRVHYHRCQLCFYLGVYRLGFCDGGLH